MLDLEPLVRSYCVSALDALVGRDEFDVIGEFGVEVPLRTIGFLFGIPEADQLAYRKRTDEALTTDGSPIAFDQSSFDESPVRARRLRRLALAEPVRRSHDRAAERRGRRTRRLAASASRATRWSPTPAWLPAPATRPQHAPHRLHDATPRSPPEAAPSARRGPIADPERYRGDPPP